MIIDEDDYLAHYGILRRSGRYPWGSGKDESTRHKMFLDYVQEMKSKGLSDADIAKGLSNPNDPKSEKVTSTQIRAAKSIALTQERLNNINQAQRLKDKGYSNQAIADRMGLAGESSVRALLAPGAKDRALILTQTADVLKEMVDQKKFLDVGAGNEVHLGISKEKMNAALAILEEKGYSVHTVDIQQSGQNKTTARVLVPPGVTQKEAWMNRDNLEFINRHSDDGGRTYPKAHPPLSINPKRIDVRFAEEGGGQADGVIYVRPGVKDTSLGLRQYAQVRVLVGKDRYLKGMAVYKDDLPDGVDLLFNTNKSRHDPDIKGNKMNALKKIESDKDFPFGSIVRQQIEHVGTPKERVTSVMNIMGLKEGSGEEGSWGTWKKSLSSQFLSKQPLSLAKAQLDETFERRRKEFDRINSLTNNTVKQELLKKFSDETDKAAVHLDAAAIKRSSWHVIMPVNTLKPNEIYAPNFRHGEKVALVRYPHGGTFEIPELTVVTKHKDAQKLLGNSPKDAVGIHHSVAQRLSGADFDGDTVLVIPNNNRKVKHTPALESLKDFDARAAYKNPKGVKFTGNTQHLMGDISNLITDMTIKGAPHSEIARAVKHSMVVIDAEKHGLNYKQSSIDHGIPQLKEKYQDGARKGAATLISKATSRLDVPHRKDRPAKEGGPIDYETGKRVMVPTGKTRLDKNGKRVPVYITSKKLAEVDDAHDLSSHTNIEKLYADHSNRLKSMANEARRNLVRTPNLEHSPSAKKAYAKEVNSLKSKLTIAAKNAPVERKALVIGNANFRAIVNDNPGMSKELKKKTKSREIDKARIAVGAKKQLITITPKEWDAIQAGAISHHQLKEILKNTDIETIRKYATPKREVLMTPANTSKARQWLALGYTRAEVADRLGVSLTTLDVATS